MKSDSANLKKVIAIGIIAMMMTVFAGMVSANTTTQTAKGYFSDSFAESDKEKGRIINPFSSNQSTFLICPPGSYARNCGGCPCQCECYNGTLGIVVGYRECKLGDSLVKDTTLTKDYTGTSPFYLVVDGIILNCNGHTLNGGGVTASDVNRVTIKNCVIVNAGISLSSSSGSTIKDNTVNSSSGYPWKGIIQIYNSNDNILTGNIASCKAYIGIGINMVSSNNNTLAGNTANENSAAGIRLVYSSHNILTGNTANRNHCRGICLDHYSSNNTLMNNNANSNDGNGIEVEYYSNNNTLTGNIANSNDCCGINVPFWSNNNRLTSNTANKNNWDGIRLYYSSYNTLTNNTVSNNRKYGIYLRDSSNHNTLTNNIVSNNDCSIYLESSNNLIYNNYFNNTNNAYDDGNNTWNITKTPGTNIIGGPYLGGNYWSDYKGIDTDEDGLGDWLTPYSCSGEIENGGDYLPLSFLSLKPGDLLLCRSPGSVVPGFWTHVGMYIGDGKVVEALPKPGVTTNPVTNWNCPAKTCVGALRVKTTDKIRNKAVSFALSQVDKPYDWCWWQKDADGEAWYCSELVWAAYLKASDGTINIEHGPDITGITPTEIDLDDDTEVISEHKEIIPKRGFWIITKSPVDLNVTDPDNLSIDKESTGISGAIYGEDDLDDDGDPDDWIGIPEQKIGNYLITVIPEPDAAPTDTYTLEVSTEDITTVLAENVSVSEIPTEPYIFESKALTFDTGSPANPYPSIFGIHNGTIKPNVTIEVSKLYTYPCAGTGGHTEYARIWNSTLDVNATWNGYVGDWHNITFDEPFTLFAEKTYYYEVRTGSYPQIIHTDEWEAKGGMGIINCTSFVDANGKIYNDWIPAIRLWAG